MGLGPSTDDVPHVEQVKHALLWRLCIDNIVQQPRDNAGCLQVNQQPRNLHTKLR